MLAAIRCPEGFTNHTDVRMQSLQLIVVCLSEDYARYLHQVPQSRINLRYLRNADGQYEADANALRGTSAAMEPDGDYRVLLTAVAMASSFGDIDDHYKYRATLIKPETPTGLVIEQGFYCSQPGTVHRFYHCRGHVLTVNVHWTMLVTFNKHQLQRLDVEQELRDALTLLQAHIAPL